MSETQQSSEQLERGTVQEGQIIRCETIACIERPPLSVGATYYTFDFVGRKCVVCSSCFLALLKMLRMVVFF